MEGTSSKHHHLVGYMTDNEGDHAIEIDFDCNNGRVQNVVYKNVRYGGKIHMQCTLFNASNINFSGKDGPKSFTINLSYDNDGNFYGSSMVGSKHLDVRLQSQCSHD